jgi:hypothetical protein
MAVLLPCRDEFAAHLVRSKLLAHGVLSVVVHDCAASAYGGWIMHPRIVIADGDLEEVHRIFLEPATSIDESFSEPEDLRLPTEQLGLQRTLPGFLEFIMVSAGITGALGLPILVLLTLVAMITSQRLPADLRFETEAIQPLLMPLEAALGGAIAGAVSWPLLIFARSCRHNERGELPLRARFVAFLMLVGG